MKKLFASILLLSLFLGQALAQTSGFKYQAVLRDDSKSLIVNEIVFLRISVLSGSNDGTAVYIEEHEVKTNDLGLVVLTIGTGDVSAGIFNDIPWGADDYFLQVDLDRLGDGYITMGSVELMAVPYAMHAQTAENVNDADADANNEIQDLVLDGNVLRISNNDNASSIDLSLYENTDAQTLSLSGTEVSISNGNSIDLASLKDDADADASNELQTISVSNDTLYLSDGGSVKLPGGFNGDYNDLSNLPANMDTDVSDDFSGNYNDLANTPSLGGDVLGDISSNTVAKIQGRTVSTSLPGDGQILKWDNTEGEWMPADDNAITAGTTDGVVSSAVVTGGATKTITLSRSNVSGDVTASFTDIVDDADADASNEIQTISLDPVSNELSLSKGGGVVPMLGWGGKESEALFAVVNTIGDTVFAVYDGGVQIYVDTDSKAARGGFAVAGRGATKGDVNDILSVTGDSVRIYVDESTKAARGGFAVAGRGATKGDASDILSVTGDSVRIYISDSETKVARGGFAVAGRGATKGEGDVDFFSINATTLPDEVLNESKILFYPSKDAFLAGTILIESPEQVGTNSTNIGFQNIAQGQYSQAFGYRSEALGANSMAVGKYAVASGANSYALGESAQAQTNESYAFGRGARAIGFRSYAFGSAGKDSTGNNTDVTIAKGDYSFSIGQGSVTGLDLADCPTKPSKFTGTQEEYHQLYYSGLGSVAIGVVDSCLGSFSTAIGYFNTASYGSVALGYKNKVRGGRSAILGGFNNEITGSNSNIVGGQYHDVDGSYASIVGGVRNKITDDAPWGFIGGGVNNEVHNSTATVLNGTYQYAYGVGSAILSGFRNQAYSYAETVVGIYNDYDNTGNTEDWIGTDNLFVVGNGSSSANRSNAMVVYKNGNTDIFGDLKINKDAGHAYLKIDGDASSRKAVEFFENGAYKAGLGYSSTEDYLFFYESSKTSMTIKNGRVGIGSNTIDPVTTLHVNHPSVYTDGFSLSNATDSDRWHFYVYSTNDLSMYFNNSARGSFSATSGAYSALSDRRLKENIKSSDDLLPQLLKLKVVDYKFIDQPDDKEYIGLIAQDVEEVFPHLVSHVEEGESMDLYTLDYSGLGTIAIKSIQEQQEIIVQQQEDIDELKKEIEELKEIVSTLIK